jgi:hypothetical protein
VKSHLYLTNNKMRTITMHSLSNSLIRTRNCIVFPFAAVLFLAIFGCSEDKQPLTVTPPPRNVEITVSVYPKYIRIKERANIIVTATNRGSVPVEFDFQCREHLGYRLEAEGGGFVFSSPGPCINDPHRFVLEPGGVETLQERTPVDLPPYQYIVKAGILGYEDEFPWAKSRLTVHW